MDTTPRYNDPDNTLLKKICLLLQGGVASGVLSFNARTGAVSLTSGDVTGALGYTPANKAGDTFSGLVTVPSLASTGAITVGVDGTDNGILVVDPDAASPVLLTRHVADNAPAILRIQKKGTTGNANNPVAANDNLGRIDFYGWDGTGYFPGAVVQLTANQTFTGSAHGGRLTVNVVANGATATTEMARFTAGALDLRNGAVLQSAGTQVVDSRKTGWTAATGTAARTTFATSTVTTEELAKRLKALIDDLISHGLIGA